MIHLLSRISKYLISDAMYIFSKESWDVNGIVSLYIVKNTFQMNQYIFGDK